MTPTDLADACPTAVATTTTDDLNPATDPTTDTDATPSADSPDTKRSPYPIAVARAARTKLGKILGGARKHGRTGDFKGPVLGYSRLERLGVDFDASEQAIEHHKSGGRDAGEDQELDQIEASEIVDAAYGYVADLYESGQEGRSLYFPVGPGQHSLVTRLSAVIVGIEADRKRGADALLPDDERLDVARAKQVRDRLQRSTQAAEGHGDDLKAAYVKRNALGDLIRTATRKAEGLVRRRNEKTPECLVDYGLKPLRHQYDPIMDADGESAVEAGSATAEGKAGKGGKAK
jgi:hypothetical protein